MSARRPVDDRSPVTRAVDAAFAKGSSKTVVPVRTPAVRYVFGSCQERVCYCHDDTAVNVVGSCGACGCRYESAPVTK